MKIKLNMCYVFSIVRSLSIAYTQSHRTNTQGMASKQEMQDSAEVTSQYVQDENRRK